jgi:putative transposase
VKVMGRLPGEHCCLSLIWAVLDRASTGWRGLTTTSTGLRQLHDLRRSLFAPPPQLPQPITTKTAEQPESVGAVA